MAECLSQYYIQLLQTIFYTHLNLDTNLKSKYWIHQKNQFCKMINDGTIYQSQQWCTKSMSLSIPNTNVNSNSSLNSDLKYFFQNKIYTTKLNLTVKLSLSPHGWTRVKIQMWNLSKSTQRNKNKNSNVKSF